MKFLIYIWLGWKNGASKCFNLHWSR